MEQKPYKSAVIRDKWLPTPGLERSRLTLTSTLTVERPTSFPGGGLTSLEKNPLKPVPQIRIELEQEEDGFFWTSRGSQTSL
ncbi:hypothetical protein JZ751_012421 [Albula glossodonta]|uniref:Uncharacterized protein n=1 Tax=Albula glossodonta TaxID=121402 RepID=A0A8T2PSA3_9TELE|nr:hypothetical protein JZ751_012421 [Albula glossodonta]